MSTLITYPTFSADVQATIDKYPALQHLLTNKRAMFAALLQSGIIGSGDTSDFDMDRWAAKLSEQFVSIDSTIDTLGYDDYNFGTSQEPITISTIFKNIIANHNKSFTDKNLTAGSITYTANMFKNDNEIIYAPSGVAAANMASCFEGCKCLIGIGDIDWSAVTNMTKCFSSCSSLILPYNWTITFPNLTTTAKCFESGNATRLGKLTLTAPKLENINNSFVNIYDEVEFINCDNITYLGGSSIGSVRKITGLNMSKVNDSYGAFYHTSTVIQELHLKEGSYIRYAQSLRGGSNNNVASSRQGATVFTLTAVSNQVKAEFISHLYNWINDPDNQKEENGGPGDLTLIEQDYPFTRVIPSGTWRTSFLSYCIENELFNCTTSDDATSADAKLKSFVEGRGWSWS